MKYIKNILLIVVLAACSFSYGQGAKDELKKVLETYLTLDRFSVDADYKAFKTHSSIEVVDQSFAEYRKDGNNLRSKNLGMEYIQNKKYSMILDENNKLILLANTQKVPEGFFGIEQTLAHFKEAKKTGQTATTVSYTVTFKEGVSELYKAVLVVYKETKLIKKAIMYYATKYAVNTEGKPDLQKPKVIIEYKNYKTGPSFQFKKGEFNISKHFITMSGNKKLKEKYKTYEFFDKTAK